MVTHSAWLNHKADMIENVLSHYRLSASVAGGIVSPDAVTFELKAQVGTKFSKVAALADVIASALAARKVHMYRQGASILIQVPRRKQPSESKPQPGHGDDMITVEATPIPTESGSWRDLSQDYLSQWDGSSHQLGDSHYEQWR